MEKEQKHIVEKMIRTSYKEPIEKVIYIYLGKAIAEMTQDMTANGHKIEPGSQISYMIMKELFSKPHVKDHLCRAVDDMNAEDVCKEILHQYGLNRDSEKTFLHDEMMKLYRNTVCEIKNKIMLELYG